MQSWLIRVYYIQTSVNTLASKNTEQSVGLLLDHFVRRQPNMNPFTAGTDFGRL